MTAPKWLKSDRYEWDADFDEWDADFDSKLLN